MEVFNGLQNKIRVFPVSTLCTLFSLLYSFGAKLRSTKLGIIYNDQLWDAVNLWVNEFNLEADALKPRKRPMSLASPSIVLDDAGNVKMVIGAAGGKYIATALSQVKSSMTRILPRRLSLQIFDYAVYKCCWHKLRAGPGKSRPAPLECCEN